MYIDPEALNYDATLERVTALTELAASVAKLHSLLLRGLRMQSSTFGSPEVKMQLAQGVFRALHDELGETVKQLEALAGLT
jgi:hypothetical protein